MKLLLTQDVETLGIVGDVVQVSAGYARNYLLPQHLATEPTDANMRRLADARKAAEERRESVMNAKKSLAERLEGTEVTIAAAANPDGVLYGSVGSREVSAALHDEGFEVDASHIDLHVPLKRLDNVVIDIKLADGITSQIKVWVVRSKASEEEGDEGEDSGYDDDAGMEAGVDGDNAES